MDETLEKEIQDTIKELEGEAPQDSAPEPKKDEAPAPEEPAKEPEGEAKTDTTPEKEEKKDEPGKVEAWRVRVMQKKHDEEIAELRRQLEAKATPSKTESPAAPVDNDDAVEQLAKEFGLEDSQKPLIAKIIDAAVSKVKLPPELEKVKDLLPSIESFKAQAEEAKAEKLFADEFETSVLPLVEAEYPGASVEALSSIKTKLKAAIQKDSRYTFTPLSVLYKALDDFRGLAPSKKGAEPTKGSSKRESSVVDYENLTAEQYDRLTPEQQDEYAEYQMRKEKNR